MVSPWRARLSWLRRQPLVGDGLLAALLAALALYQLFHPITSRGLDPREPDALGVLLVLLAFFPLAFRRRQPLPIFVIVVIPAVLLEVLNYPSALGGLGVLVGVYTVAAYARRRRSIVALSLALIGTAIALAAASVPLAGSDLIVSLLTLAIAWVLGRNTRTRRLYTTELEARAERLEEEQAAQAAAAVASERARIAREMHDLVAHHVSVITVQASAARRMLDRDPERARQAVCTIESTGRTALQEMRQLLGVLRAPDEADHGQLTPQPGLEEVVLLLDKVRAAGLPVELVVEGTARPLAPGTDLTAYRVVQEALGNALKHAGPASARVVLRYTTSDLEVRVYDDGRGSAAGLDDRARQAGPGHGLVGMRERVAMVGGQLRAGPRSGGGFEVLARLPLERISV